MIILLCINKIIIPATRFLNVLLFLLVVDEQSLVGGAECDQAAGGWSGAALHQPSHQQPVLGDALPGRTPFQEL